MKRLNVLVLAAIILLFTGVFSTAYCSDTNSPSQDVVEDNQQIDDEVEYSHESVLPDEVESEYEDPQTDEDISDETEEEKDDSNQTETMEEGDEV